MATTFSPIDAATIAALKSGDESALERILRSHHDVLLERARERLKDEPAAASRLVVATLRELWAERARFSSSAEVEGFLNEELRNRASAVRARMAAVHRFEKAEHVKAGAHAEPTVDQMWSDLRAAINRPATDPAEAARSRREHAKHDAASHIAHVAERRSIMVPVMLGVLGALVLIAGVWWMGRSSRQSVLAEMLAAAEGDAITTRAGQLGSLSLGDGTAVRLGAESKLVAVSPFGRKYRTAAVTGTAAFTVSDASDVPFEARLGDAVIDAGTGGGTLMLRGYPEDSVRYVRVGEGSARVRTTTGTRALEAGQAVAIDATGALRDASAAEVEQAFAWMDGRLVLREVSVAEAAHQLLRWYGMLVTVPDSSVAARRASVEASLESSQAALAAMEGSAGVRFLWEDGKMVFRDAAATASKAPGRARR